VVLTKNGAGNPTVGNPAVAAGPLLALGGGKQPQGCCPSCANHQGWCEWVAFARR